MKKWRQKKTRAPLDVSEARNNFQSVLSNIEQALQFHIDQTGDVYAASELYTYAMTALGRLIACETDVRILRSAESDCEPSESAFDIPQRVCIGQHKKMALRSFAVAALPWNSIRLVHAIQSVFENGFRPDWNTTNGILFQELDFVVILNGRHHTAAAKLYQEGSATLDVYSLRDTFPTVRTDGVRWYSADTNATLGTVSDDRFALMYELARRRAVFLSGTARAARPSGEGAGQGPVLDSSDNMASWRLLEALELAHRENYMLKQNNALLLKRLATLQSEPRNEP